MKLVKHSMALIDNNSSTTVLIVGGIQAVSNRNDPLKSKLIIFLNPLFWKFQMGDFVNYLAEAELKFQKRYNFQGTLKLDFAPRF